MRMHPFHLSYPLPPFLHLLRPAQWIKNIVVLAPLFFSLWNASSPTPSLAPLTPALLAFLAFCLLSSSIYILNDIADAPRDRLHPRKHRRPIASGDVSPLPAIGLMIALLLTTFLIGFAIHTHTALTFALYLHLQVLYTLALKRIPVLDVATIASGFVLRLTAGGTACHIPLSPWILLCTFSLALFLALCKRRQEKAELTSTASHTRPSLRHLSLRTLDRLVYTVATITLLSYAAYTQAPSTLHNFGTRGLCLTLPFVAFGLVRYLILLHRHDETERPERVLLSDLPLLINILLFGAAVAAIFIFRAHL